jgi:hypothetical protein
VPWWPSPVTSRLGSPGVAGHGDAAAVEAPAKARHGGFQTVESVQHALEVLDTEAPDPRRAGVLGREAKCPGVGVGCRWTARPQLPGRLSGAPSRSDQRQANLRSLIACQVVLLRGGWPVLGEALFQSFAEVGGDLSGCRPADGRFGRTRSGIPVRWATS